MVYDRLLFPYVIVYTVSDLRNQPFQPWLAQILCGEFRLSLGQCAWVSGQQGQSLSCEVILTSVANSRSFDSDSGPNFLLIGILIFMFFSSFYVRVNLRFTQNQIVSGLHMQIQIC